MDRKRFIQRVMQLIATCVIVLVLSMIAMIWYLSHSLHKLDLYCARMHVGMTVREFVKVMPTDYFTAKVLRERRNFPCRGPKGEFEPPESGDLSPSKAVEIPPKAEIARLAPCPAVTFVHFKHTGDGKIYLEVQSFGGGKVVTVDEFTEFVEKEFRGTGFYFGFTYLTMTPQHQSFGFDFDADGRIKNIVRPYGWD